MQRRRKKKDAGDRTEIPAGVGPATPDGFEAREGDTITVKYDGATLQIAPFSSVTLDSVIYSRRLREGEDPAEAFDQIHGYLKKKCLEKAREKLATFADEHRRARVRAGTDRG